MHEPEKKETATSGGLSVSEATTMYDQYKTYWNENYNEAKTDLNFYLGKDHWDEADLTARRESGKISLVINELPQFVHQVTNDIRQNVPSIKALPDADGDIETGKIYTGLFRAIEYRSHSDEVCDTAAEYAVKCGIGFMAIDHDYIDDESDEQEILFKTVPDPLSVFLDPSSVEYDGRDANSVIVLENISKKDFERLYPGKAFTSFTDPQNKENQDNIVLGQIFIREFTGKHGKTAIINRYKFSGSDRLGSTTFPGKYIPYVPIYGEVTWVNGKRIVSSLIRQARDPQKRLNHWASKEAEILSMAPIAPVMAAVGVIVNDRGQWQRPGSEMVLEYNQMDADGNPAPAPQRLAPPPIPTGIINAMEGAKENIKESMGLYNASIGNKSNEVSGVAIDARKHEGDVNTFHFADNARRSYGHMGEVAIEMMPVIYDTPRIVQTLNDEMDVEMVGINNAPMQEGQKQAYDLTKGKYHVRITTGASYTTKRQEEAAFLTSVFEKDPALMQIGGDILFKSMDMPGAQAMAARLKKTIPAQLLDDNQDDPKVVQLTQQLQQAQQIIDAGKQELQQMQQQLDSKQVEDQVKLSDAEVKRAEVGIKQEEVAIKKGELNLKYLQAANDTGETNEAVTAPTEEEPVEVMQAKVQSKVNAKQQSDMMAQQQADNDALIAQQQLALEQQELQLKEAELQQRQTQGDALIGTLGAVVSRLDLLTAQAGKPINVIRDANGVILGAN